MTAAYQHLAIEALTRCQNIPSVTVNTAIHSLEQWTKLCPRRPVRAVTPT